MEVDDAAVYNTSCTKTVVVPKATASGGGGAAACSLATTTSTTTSTKVQPSSSSATAVALLANKTSQKLLNSKKIKSPKEEDLEEYNSIKLFMSSEEEIDNIEEEDNDEDYNDDVDDDDEEEEDTIEKYIAKKEEEVELEAAELKVELNSDEEKTVKFCAKRKRYEVSDSNSQEVFLGCDEASGETCLISESAAEPEIVATLAPQTNNNNNNIMAETRTSSRQNNNKKLANIEAKDDEIANAVGRKQDKQEEVENAAPPAKRIKKNSPSSEVVAKASPTRKAVEIEAKMAHVVADGDVPVVNKTRSTNNAQKQVAATAAAANTANNNNKPKGAQDDIYKKPFEYGWKRELVWRSTPESGRERADVYFISPGGKKIRTRHDIPPLLQGDLKMENFCWLREPVGVGPEFETVRNAKPNPNRSTAYAAVALAASAAVNTPVSGKRMPKPKGPKGASPPPEGWTPTRALKVNNAALNSRSSASQSYRSAGTPVTRNNAGSSNTPSGSNRRKTTKCSTTIATTTSVTATTTSQSMNFVNAHNNNNRNKNNAKNLGEGERVNNTSSIKKPIAESSVVATDKQKVLTSDKDLNYQNILLNRNVCEPCTIMCTRAPGLIPQLQCVKCLCLYHHQCVGLSPNSSLYRRAGDGPNGREYVCESCAPKNKNDAAIKNPTNSMSSNASSSSTSSVVAAAPSSKSASSIKITPTTKFKPTTTAPRTLGGATSTPKTTATTTSSGRSTATSLNKRSASSGGGGGSNNKYPQTIAVVKGKKYVVVDKPRNKNKHSEYANDIENDLKQINESIRNSLPTQPSLSKLEIAYQQQQQNTLALASMSNQSYGKNFFANMSFGFDSMLIILKYLKIHERMRFASVCKLWYEAANSRSVWQTVRMKNSKVCDWAGCAAALQRNGTRHLDLRKMLFASSRADEMWAQFSANIGTACFLETIDLCRCPARVVEALFKSNKNLRILNAMTINDDALNLEHLDNLSNLVELRLRTNELAVLTHDLSPLASMTKLTHFSLTATRSLGSKSIEALKHLTALRSLELGECGDLDETFAHEVLPQLVQLQRLRLENGQNSDCCTTTIMQSASKLKHLNQLELINFDVDSSFEELLQQFKALTKLLIIPTYLSQSATTNQTVLSAVQKIAPQLKVFTWGVTVELLRVTALYVDQCEESSKKEKHNFNECIPVLKPVPGAAAVDDHDTELDNSGSTNGATLAPTGDGEAPALANDVPQIEILPIDKVERILAANMPNTKFQIVKVPHQATCKQQLVE